MKKNKKKLQPRKKRNNSTSEIPTQVYEVLIDGDMDFQDGMVLTFPFYYRDGELWIPSTPWEAGEYEGTEWVKSAKPSTLRNAAERLTTNELIVQHLIWCNQCESDGKPYNGDLLVTPPSEFHSDADVRSFFHDIVTSPGCYQGNDADIKIGKYAITGIPANNLRKFEDGWTASVRNHWEKTKSSEQSLN